MHNRSLCEFFVVGKRFGPFIGNVNKIITYLILGIDIAEFLIHQHGLLSLVVSERHEQIEVMIPSCFRR